MTSDGVERDYAELPDLATIVSLPGTIRNEALDGPGDDIAVYVAIVAASTGG